MSFSAALLAGGRSRRMGHDKAFLEIGDPPQPLWQRQLRVLESLGADQILLSHNADQEFDAPAGVELVEDAEDDRGPLGGLVSCLRQAKNSRLLVLAVDLPYATPEFLTGLLAVDAGLVLRDAELGRYEAVVAVYTLNCLPVAEARLQRDELAMQSFIAECVQANFLTVKDLGDDDRPMLKNWNRPQDIVGT